MTEAGGNGRGAAGGGRLAYQQVVVVGSGRQVHLGGGSEQHALALVIKGLRQPVQGAGFPPGPNQGDQQRLPLLKAVIFLTE
ncbi:hypothetical protein D3C76_1597090 [compost metagenome]